MAGETVCADVRSLKLTVSSSGIVWALDHDELPRSTGMSVADFLVSQSDKNPRCLRVPGYGANGALLLGLDAQRAQGFHLSLEVCSPALCGGLSESADVQLYTARGCRLPASLGGWHPFTLNDGLSYGLNMFVAGRLPWDDQAVELLLSRHPAYKSLKFISGCDWRSAAIVIGSVIDPRYFVDPVDPDGPPFRLLQFLGLDSKTQAEHPSDNTRGVRYSAVLGCWAGPPPIPERATLTPGQFPWRAYYAKNNPDKGTLAASRRCVDFLRQTWTAAVCTCGQSSRLFSPRIFFEDPETAAAYKAHLETA